MIAVFTPITRPVPSSSGPPELPGFRGAVCWMTPSISRLPLPRRLRPSAETTPVDTVDSKPSGLPIATASWPTRGDSAASTGRYVGSAAASVRSSARSVAGSSPTICASRVSPVGVRTLTWRAPWTTWLFVIT